MGRLRQALTPPGVTWALMCLGTAFVVLYPLPRSGTLYALFLLVAIVGGVRVHRRRRLTVLERRETETERIWVIRFRVKKGRGKLAPEPALPEGPDPEANSPVRTAALPEVARPAERQNIAPAARPASRRDAP
jgi:hypothetical protein